MIGKLIYIADTERIAIYYDGKDDYNELHCGDQLKIFYKGKWTTTRIEYDIQEEEWYLVGLAELKGFKMLGLAVSN